ncbi:hypothetical protein ACROYT_G015224 [Oculina patagonica]
MDEEGGVEEYAAFFDDQVIDGESLKCLNEETLKTLVPLAGPHLKIMDKIKKLNAQESMENCSFQSMSSGIPTFVVQEEEPLAANKAFGNVLQIMLKKKRGTKCPFLSKSIRLGLAEGTDDDFVASETIFQEYSAVVARWTDGDSFRGQTKYLMKNTAFLKVHNVLTDQCRVGNCACLKGTS